ncbi:MAG: AIR synthase-related protein, partial [Dehalococcoidia bacterium]|nr:AIR synthase-related protein [Dehalococcoidia bacterium]
GFPAEGLAVMLLGPGLGSAVDEDLAGSEYLQVMHGLTAGQPRINLQLERRVQESVREGIGEGLIKSAHDCSDGGLGVALAESCILGGVGFHGNLDAVRWDVALFGEKQSRIVVSLDPADIPKLTDLARSRGVPLASLGRTGGYRLVLRIGDEATNDGSNGGPPAIDLPLERMSEAWMHALEDMGD